MSFAKQLGWPSQRKLQSPRCHPFLSIALTRPKGIATSNKTLLGTKSIATDRRFFQAVATDLVTFTFQKLAFPISHPLLAKARWSLAVLRKWFDKDGAFSGGPTQRLR